MHDLTAFQRDTLFVIAGLSDDAGSIDEMPHGLEIKEHLSDYYEEEVHHGRLYPNLDSLADRGLIEKRAKDDRTNAYVLTEKGRRMIDTRREWEHDRTAEVIEQ